MSRTVALSEGSAAINRVIASLRRRSKTGASIVGIKRAGQANVINPGANEELRPGDPLLLLGSEEQLTAAETLLVARR